MTLRRLSKAVVLSVPCISERAREDRKSRFSEDKFRKALWGEYGFE